MMTIIQDMADMRMSRLEGSSRTDPVGEFIRRYS